MENARVLNQKELVELVLNNQTVSISENVEFQRELFITEYWRLLLHDLASKEHSEGVNNNIKPVRIRKRTLLQYLDTIWPELRDEESQNTTDVISSVCSRLEQIGDMVRLRNGYFLPTPLRLIELPESQYSVVVGGIPTEIIRLLLPDAKIAGYGRIIENQKIPDTVKRDRGWWQEYTNWVGWKPTSLENWVEMQIIQLSSSGSQSIQGFEEFEVFNTSGNRKNNNRSLWINQSSILDQGTSGTWLCKTTDSNKRYFLGEFNDGHLMKELSITDKDTRLWLMLGLRVYNRHFPVAHWNNNYLKVIPQLPRAIERHVLIFSFKQNAYEYYVSEQFHNHVEQLLKSYGYQFPVRRRTKDE
ncbi:hypothetical protein P4H61_16255 [Paenibacillus peoriae]|uniref:hypothetical protein n=1 Tax=Paenibacillus peoriae TaxID=59893 RepID=UPI00026C5C86|nr:hypothetical protein [Paenibacillus peoriae]MEC0183039.1 hypothetical protein [Paenibacillus peoriae]